MFYPPNNCFTLITNLLSARIGVVHAYSNYIMSAELLRVYRHLDPLGCPQDLFHVHTGENSFECSIPEICVTLIANMFLARLAGSHL